LRLRQRLLHGGTLPSDQAIALVNGICEHVHLAGEALPLVVALTGLSWYSRHMEQTPFALTPKQHGILTALSRETGKPIPALVDEALEALQERTPRAPINGHAPTSRAPSESAWTEHKNQRRCHLVDKDIDGTISLAEKGELEQLQAEMFAYRRHVAPLPLDDLRTLHQQLLHHASEQPTARR
jgi:hypothetical protein